MHKFITAFFSFILSIFHIIFFLGLGAVLLVGGASLPDTGLNPVQLFMGIVGSAILYVLFAGVTSVLIRINQNLEAISNDLKKMASDYDEIESD